MSNTCDVVSGFVQCSELGPILQVMATSLVKLPYGAFVDDLKFAGDVIKNIRNITHGNIDVVANWADAYYLLISIEKSCVITAGKTDLIMRVRCVDLQ